MHTNPRLLLQGAEVPHEDQWPESRGSLPAVQGQGQELGQPCCRDRAKDRARLVSQLAVVVGAVPLDVDAAHAVAQLEAVVVLTVRGLAAAAAGGLQQGVVGDTGGLVQQHVQGLLVDPGLGELHLQNTARGLFLTRSE